MKFSLTISTLTIALSFSPLNHAASSCKGLSVEKCLTNTSCSWIKSFKRKDGKMTKAYCRSKPSKKAVKKSIDKALNKAKSTTSKEAKKAQKKATKVDSKK